MEFTDDFDNLPVEDIALEVELLPSDSEIKEESFRKALGKTPAVPTLLGKSKQLISLAGKGKPAAQIAESLNLPTKDVEVFIENVDALAPEAKKEFLDFAKNADVFDLNNGLRYLCWEVVQLMRLLGDNVELKLQCMGELRQVFKLAKDYMRESAYLEMERRERQEDTAIILEELNNLDPAAATRLFKKIEERKSRRRTVGGH